MKFQLETVHAGCLSFEFIQKDADVSVAWEHLPEYTLHLDDEVIKEGGGFIAMWLQEQADYAETFRFGNNAGPTRTSICLPSSARHPGEIGVLASFGEESSRYGGMCAVRGTWKMFRAAADPCCLEAFKEHLTAFKERLTQRPMV
jgi:hypothetical protein